jgi:hypothetical protein
VGSVFASFGEHKAGEKYTMKATAKPEFSKKWWTSEKPADIKGTVLEKALAGVEKALAEEKKKRDAAALEAAAVACGELEEAVDWTIKKECDKKKHKDVITVLERYFPLIKDEKGRLQKLLEEAGKGDDVEDEEETDDKIFQPEYLYKMLKLLKSTGKELNFGFGLDTKNPEASKLVLTRKGKPERLFKALKQTGDFSNRLITYGKAVPDAQDGKVLVFKLAESAGEPPQVLKLGRRFLRADKGLKFRKLRLIMPGGQVFDDTDPDTEDEQVPTSQGGGDLPSRLRSAAAAAEIWGQTRAKVVDQIEQLRRELNAFDDAEVRGLNDRLGIMLERYPDLDLNTLAKSTDQASFDRTFAQTRRVFDSWTRIIKDDPALHAIDENPFVKINLVSTYSEALRGVASQLQLSAAK